MKNNEIIEACKKGIENISVYSGRYAEKLRTLTDRETEVLYLISKGLNNAEIAEKMIISQQTVKNHINHIFAKLETQNRTKAAVMAWEEGLAYLPEDFF